MRPLNLGIVERLGSFLGFLRLVRIPPPSRRDFRFEEHGYILPSNMAYQSLQATSVQVWTQQAQEAPHTEDLGSHFENPCLDLSRRK